MENDLESKGWRQGSVVRSKDVPTVLQDVSIPRPENALVVVVSQSCDIAQPSETEPNVEIIVAEYIDSPNGNFTFAKNARVLDVTLKEATADLDVTRDAHARLRALEKRRVSKARFLGLRPTARKLIPRAELDNLASWLAARYSRPAFPTDFNNALIAADPSGKKLKRIAKRLSPCISGLYINLHPDRDIRDGERYRVNLLGTLLPSAVDRRASVDEDVDSIGKLMTDAGMEVETAVRLEDEISIATIKSFRRLYLDDISLRNDDPLPLEVNSSHRTDTS